MEKGLSNMILFIREMTYAEKYKNELTYIDHFWNKVIVKPRRRDRLLNLILSRTKKQVHKNILNVPKSFVVPNDKKFTHVFYWDTFFMFRGFIRTRREWIMRSMVDNFIYLYEKHGIIPNFNSPAATGRSQPPFLTSMILDVYNGYYFAWRGANPFKKLVYDLDYYKVWLKKAAEVAKREYIRVWIDEDHLFHHSARGFGLSCYGDRDLGYALSAELESGWDFTSRFYNRCSEFLPIDLNSYLFKYERDFAKIAAILGDSNEQKKWRDAKEKRREEVNKYMWNADEGFFFDYSHKFRRQSDFLSLAGFTPLWTGLATSKQASQMVKKLPVFETDYGLVITAKESLAPRISLRRIPIRYRPAIENVLAHKQWDWPNIWPPLEYLTVIGLMKYGFVNDAVRIMKKSLSAESEIFKKYNTFFEKFDGVKCDKTGDYHYTNQEGFGWTNAVFYRYVQILDEIEKGSKIFAEPKASQPPYKLSIPH
jgi:alpha,alpha-trehalase